MLGAVLFIHNHQTPAVCFVTRILELLSLGNDFLNVRGERTMEYSGVVVINLNKEVAFRVLAVFHYVGTYIIHLCYVFTVCGYFFACNYTLHRYRWVKPIF